MTRVIFVGMLLLALLVAGCGKESTDSQATIPQVKQSPEPVPKGILVKEIPANADVIFSSIRYVLDDMACLDDNYELKNKFIQQPDCKPAYLMPVSQKRFFIHFHPYFYTLACRHRISMLLADARQYMGNLS